MPVTARLDSVGNGSDASSQTAVSSGGAAVKASGPHLLPDAHSEFLRMGDLRRLFGITRATGYQLAKAGRIRTVSLRQPGSARGVRLVNAASVRDYLARLEVRQTGNEGGLP